MEQQALDKLARIFQRIGVTTFVAGLVYGAVLHGPYVYWVVVG